MTVDHAPNILLRPREPLGIDVAEADVRVSQRGQRENVPRELAAELAPRSDDHDLGHARKIHRGNHRLLLIF
jgi:hypothetical protein